MESSNPSVTAKAIVVTNSITFNDFLKHNIIQQIRGSLWIFIVIFIGMEAYIAYQVIFGDTPVNFFPTFHTVYAVYIFIVMPIVIYIQSKKYYKTNKYLKENITYTFTQEGVESVGETFYIKLAWTGFYKVEELKDWLLIYTDQYAAIRILKKNFKSIEELQELKEIIKSKPIKQKLKKQ